MNSLIETFKKQSDYSFAKNVIQNMQNDLVIPFNFISCLDLKRKRIYWNLYFKPDSDEEFETTNLLVLKNLVKFCPEKIKKDFLDFKDFFCKDNDFEFKIDCPKIKRQIKKLF